MASQERLATLRVKATQVRHFVRGYEDDIDARIRHHMKVGEPHSAGVVYELLSLKNDHKPTLDARPIGLEVGLPMQDFYDGLPTFLQSIQELIDCRKSC